MLRPIKTKILAEIIPRKLVTDGGILLPNRPELTYETEKLYGPLKARVLAIGKDVTTIKVGDIVWLAGFASQDVEYDGKKLVFIYEQNATVVIDEEDGV